RTARPRLPQDPNFVLLAKWEVLLGINPHDLLRLVFQALSGDDTGGGANVRHSERPGQFDDFLEILIAALARVEVRGDVVLRVADHGNVQAGPRDGRAHALDYLAA